MFEKALGQLSESFPLLITICRPKISPPKVIYKVQSMPYKSLPLGAFWTIFGRNFPTGVLQLLYPYQSANPLVESMFKALSFKHTALKLSSYIWATDRIFYTQTLILVRLILVKKISLSFIAPSPGDEFARQLSESNPTSVPELFIPKKPESEAVRVNFSRRNKFENIEQITSISG